MKLGGLKLRSSNGVPWSVQEIEEEGMNALADKAARKARMEVWRDCLTVYESALEQYKLPTVEPGYFHLLGEIELLRRRLGIRSPEKPEQIEKRRERTRERVRRFRERQQKTSLNVAPGRPKRGWTG